MAITKTPIESNEHLIDKAASKVGSRKNLADQLGVSISALGNWKSRGVPAEQCPAIEQATDGLVRCEDLRPDVPWSVVRGNPAQPHTDQAQAATDSVAVGTIPTEVGALRTGTVRRHFSRRLKDQPLDADRRAKGGPPYQSLETGVA